MKRIILIISLNISVSLFSQNSNFFEKDSLTKNLIGVWQIQKVIDKEGKEVNTIYKEMKGSPLGDKIEVLATGPKITLQSNGTFELEFTPENTEKGRWFLENSETLIFQLIAKKGTSSYESLKSIALTFGKKINFDSDGNIIENISNKIAKLKKEELLMVYETDYFQVYKRITGEDITKLISK
jgi:hypothetical protein